MGLRHRWISPLILGAALTCGVLVALGSVALASWQGRTMMAGGAVRLGTGHGSVKQPGAISSQLPRILIEKIGSHSPRVLYKPRNFCPSSHYCVRNAHWIRWTASSAVAQAVLRIQFPTEPAEEETTTITYSAPRHACGSYTYTMFRSASGARAKLVDEPGLCLFIVQ